MEERFEPRIVEYRVRMNLQEKLLHIEAEVLLRAGNETVSLYRGPYGDEGEVAEIIGDTLGKPSHEVCEQADTQYIRRLCSA